MKIIRPSAVVLSDIDGEAALRLIEAAGRVCYKSEGRIGDGTADKFVSALLKRGHESVIEHVSVTVKIVCDRGVTHELVRHRIASYSQESTRYCNYSSGKFGGEVTFVEPSFYYDESPERRSLWVAAMESAERSYSALIAAGATPEEARDVLPNSLKTEIVMTANLREWRHFFRLRLDEKAHPQMREVARLVLAALRERIPVVFDDFE